jgi:hypothetical protein
MFTERQFGYLRDRIKTAWGSDITDEMKKSLRRGSFAVIDHMKHSVLQDLSPRTVSRMIEEGQIQEMQEVAKTLIPRLDLIDQVVQISLVNGK